MKHKSGEAILGGIIIGAIVGAIILVIDAGNTAQDIANRTGIATSPLEVIADDPGGSALSLAAPAVAGAGIGWIVDELSGKNDSKSNSRDNNISVSGEDNDVNITIDGDDSDDDINEDNDENDQDNSGNTTEN